MMLTWLADVLRAAGLTVYELPGWQTRETRAGFDPQGIVCHHTATSTGWLDGHVAALLRDGRRDLSGPLAQLGLERDGTFVTIAAGRCNHNGYGTWGNDSIGIEAYNDGVGEPWPAVQMDAYRRGVAAICARTGWGVLSHVKGHKETDPQRKVDPTFDMNQFRVAVANPPAQEAPDMTPAESAKLEKIESYVEGIVNRLNLAQSTLGRILTAIAAVDGVDEAALAGELGPVLAGSIPAVSDSDLERIAKAVADEQATRLTPDAPDA